MCSYAYIGNFKKKKTVSDLKFLQSVSVWNWLLLGFFYLFVCLNLEVEMVQLYFFQSFNAF